MGLTRADWFLDVEVEDGDPFAATAAEVVGQPIVLVEDEGELRVALADTLTREGELFTRGVVCALKDAPDSTCCSCPIRGAQNGEMATLCSVGREQEAISSKLAALRVLAAT